MTITIITNLNNNPLKNYLNSGLLIKFTFNYTTLTILIVPIPGFGPDSDLKLIDFPEWATGNRD